VKVNQHEKHPPREGPIGCVVNLLRRNTFPPSGGDPGPGPAANERPARSVSSGRRRLLNRRLGKVFRVKRNTLVAETL
jgi:hypothetical protein